MEVIRRFCVGGEFVREEGEGEKGEGVMGWAVGFVIEYCGKGEGEIVIFPKFLKYVGCLFEYDDLWWGR